MSYLNEITGVIALALMLLTARGFVPHIRLGGHTPASYLMQGIAIGATAVGLRLAVFDLARPLLRAFGYLADTDPSLAVQATIAVINVGLGLSAWRVLKGLHASLPEEEQAHYSWLTVAFYPRRLTLLGFR